MRITIPYSVNWPDRTGVLHPTIGFAEAGGDWAGNNGLKTRPGIGIDLRI